MSVSLTIRWVFGYHDPTGKSFGLDRTYEEGPINGVSVESVECMGGDSGTLVFAAESVTKIFNDRDGYEITSPVMKVSDLNKDPRAIARYRASLKKAIGTLPPENRPTEPPQWILHTDCG